MAINRSDTYPGRWEVGDAEYPGGKAKNRTTPLSEDGTYYEKRWLNDAFGFFDALLTDAGVVRSGVPDTALASDHLDAVKAIITASDIDGNAATATALETARNINGVPFDGTSNITVFDDTKLPLTGGSLTGDLSTTGVYTSSNTSGVFQFGNVFINSAISAIYNTVDDDELKLRGGTSVGTGGSIELYGPDRPNSPNGVAFINGSTVTGVMEAEGLRLGLGIRVLSTNDGVEINGANDSPNVQVQQQSVRVVTNPAFVAWHGTDEVFKVDYQGVAFGKRCTANTSDAPSYLSGFGTATPPLHFRGDYSGTTTFNVFGNTGTVTNQSGSYSAISDTRLKDDIAKCGSQLQDIKLISDNMVKYRLKSDILRLGDSAPVLIGVLSRDATLSDGTEIKGMRSISPGVVGETTHHSVVVEGEEPVESTVDYVSHSVIFLKMLKAFGEMVGEMEDLKARVAVLESAK